MDFIKDTIIDKVKEKVEEITNDQIKLDPSGGIQVDGNKYIDELLDNVNAKIKDAGIDRADLPTQSMDFEKSIACGLSISGQAELNNGCASGLDTICRFADTKVDIHMFNDPLLSVSTSLGIKRAAIDYTVNAQVFCLSREIKIVGSLSDIKLSLELKVAKDFKVSLEKYDIAYRGDLDLDLTELESFDHTLRDNVSDELQSTIKESVADYMEKAIKNIVADVLSKFGWKL